ncbi:response regulator [Paenibacillus sp. BC26]|uniref:response regulator n=1 Tax=Paenibacillus sp. BC26 TaxID=1881032 RepID=UPI000B8A43BE|nr:response regulator [Paenibacillus sp. BC26]
MINLMIVDDEETTRNSLMELVPWSDWGITEAHSAENGIAALALAEKFKPSILLTDIRMPKMNGIELAQRFRNLYPECEIVFLSGFSDKEYLKSAIQLHAVDYLDKPVDMEQLKTLFIAVVKKIEHAATQKVDIQYRREEIVVDVICNKTDLSVWMDRVDSGILPLTASEPFRVYTFLFNWSSATAEDEKPLIKQRILHLLNHAPSNTDLRYIAGFVGDRCLAIIANDAAAVQQAKADAFARHMLDWIQEASQGNYSLSAGCSDQTVRTDAFSLSYKAATEAARRQFYAGTNRIYFPNAAAPGCYDLDKGVYNRFKKMLRSDPPEAIIDYVNQLTEAIAGAEDPDMNKIRNLYFNHLRILFEVTMQWDAADSGDEQETTYMWREIDTRITLNELAAFLRSNIEMTMMKPESKAGGIEKIDEIKKYIASHYDSNQLSIQTIAQHTYLSQTYLCAFFKKSTGRTLNEFITALRIEKAKGLLQDRNKKLYDITTEIGLTDTNYFSTLFKKYTGSTPSEYRMKQLYES